MAKRKAPHVAGEYWIGGVTPYRPPHTLSAIEAAARAREIRERWLPVAEQRRDAGRRWYDGICRVYYAELAQLDAVIAEQPAALKRAA